AAEESPTEVTAVRRKRLVERSRTAVALSQTHSMYPDALRVAGHLDDCIALFQLLQLVVLSRQDFNIIDRWVPPAAGHPEKVNLSAGCVDQFAPLTTRF